MRLNINLASHPYRDVRRFLATWGVGAAVLVLVTIALGLYAAYGWRQSRTIREQVSQLRNEIDKFDRERAAAIALLNQPQNREVAAQAAFLNELMARRSFSWTRLFMELEKIMPARLHVLSITPALNKQNQIEIHMVVGGDSRQQAVELVERLEDSASFRQPELRTELFGTLSGGDRVQFEIASVYIPSAVTAPASDSASSKQQAAKTDKPEKQPKTQPTSVQAAGKKDLPRQAKQPLQPTPQQRSPMTPRVASTVPAQASAGGGR